VRLIADANIVAQAVHAMRAAGPPTLPSPARGGGEGGGVLVHRDLQPHCGVLQLDDLGDAGAESRLILATLSSHGDRLAARAFLRAGDAGSASRGVNCYLSSHRRSLPLAGNRGPVPIVDIDPGLRRDDKMVGAIFCRVVRLQGSGNSAVIRTKYYESGASLTARVPGSRCPNPRRCGPSQSDRLP
jgi:hypothetical protein